MADTLKCPRCSSDLPPGFPEGICPTCLMQQGLSPSTLDHSRSSPSGSGRNRHWIPPTPAELAPRFPQLEIIELLGQGGMGAVYKVRQKDLDRWAALKVLPDDVAHDPTFAERFQREARALALLGHQHIVIVYEFGQRDGVYYLLMEYIDGVTLRQAIRAGQVSSKDALSIVAQICDALQFAHEEGVVHRDIKPENILIDRRGRVKIADFGLAKMLGRSVAVPTLTGTHQVMGTPIYMAPEQMEGTRSVDHRADIFSLGVVFYELLTGELPLGRFAPPSQKYQLDVRLDEVVLRTLEKEPDRRYQQASEVKNDVESIRNPHPSTMRSAPSPADARSRGWRQRPVERPTPPRPWLRLGLLVAVLAVIFVMFVGTFALPILFYMWSSASLDSATVSTMTEIEHQRRTNAAAQAQFQETLRLQQMQQERQKRSFELVQDQNEVDAAVLFVNGIPELNREFGAELFDAQRRQKVNQILASIHQKYLKSEREHTTTERYPDGSQFTVITPFAVQVAELENELWTEIDAQVPVGEQKWLRANLPLFAESTKPFPSAGGLPIRPSESGPAPMMGMMMGGGATAGGAGPADFPHNIRYAQLLGWKDAGGPIRISIARRGTWYRWSIEYEMKMLQNSPNAYNQVVKDQGEDPQLPSGLQRFWNNDPQPAHGTDGEKPALDANQTATGDVEAPKPAIEESSTDEQPTSTSGNAPAVALSGNESAYRRPSLPLNDKLRELDSLRAGQQTQWSEVQRCINELLSSYTKPAEQGQIYWQATMVYGQSDIHGHAAEVTYYAKRALAIVLDPSQRGWLYMYLGNAAEARDIDPDRYLQNRTEAARWYIKGFAELSAFDLPNEPPELPILQRFERSSSNTTEGLLDDIASQVRLDAQIKRRQEVQTIRDLIHHRTIYLDRLKDLFGRLHDLYDKDANRQDRLRTIATEILKDPEAVERLLHLVIPPQG